MSKQIIVRRPPKGKRWIYLGSIGASATLNLSISTISEDAIVGDLVGTLSVSGGTGIYTYSLTSNPGSLFAIDGDLLEVDDTLTAGSVSITVEADNGAGSVVSSAFLITVTPVGGGVAAGTLLWTVPLITQAS